MALEEQIESENVIESEMVRKMSVGGRLGRGGLVRDGRVVWDRDGLERSARGIGSVGGTFCALIR